MAKELWITNISNMNVSLRDLNLTVKPYHSINLLDKKHYNYTIEQIVNSVKKGSIFSKRDKIFVRRVAPKKNSYGQVYAVNALFEQEKMSVNFDANMPNTRTKSVINVNEEVIDLFLDEEKKSSDEKYAEENAELAEMDEKPIRFKG